MYKFWGLFVSLALTCFIAGPAFAATETTLSFTFKVKTVFKLSLQKSEIDFGSVEPNEVVEFPELLTVVAETNTGKPWQLKVSSPSDFLGIDDPTHSFDISSLHMSGSAVRTRKTGTLIGAKQSVTKAGSTIYESPSQSLASIDNINTDTGGTFIDLKLEIQAPNQALAGRYESALVFTLTE